MPTRTPVAPYIDRARHWDAVPWGTQSYYRQPWRAYLQTVPAASMLAGIGIMYNLAPTANHEAACELLARAGIRHARYEAPWTWVPWDESALVYAATVTRVVTALLANGIRPSLLLNANDAQPCPVQLFTRTVVGDTAAGATSITLSDTTGFVPHQTGITGWGLPMAGVLVTSIAGATCTLSKPLPGALANGATVNLATLKYEPLWNVGSGQFEATMAGWLTYVRLLLAAVPNPSACDFEVWNETSFGSAFLDVNNYYATPVCAVPNQLQEGGTMWELSKRTAAALKAAAPTCRVIWGFSASSFFRTTVPLMPPLFDGQSFHPYGTDRQRVPEDAPDPAQVTWFLEGYPPPTRLLRNMPEGWAHLATKTEFVPRLIAPWVATPGWLYAFTEHGGAPAGTQAIGLDPLAYKAKQTLRALALWLNKGLGLVDIFCAHDAGGDTGFGLLTTSPDPATYTIPQPLSPVLAAIQRFTQAFAGAVTPALVPPGIPRSLGVTPTALGTVPVVFAGDATHPDLLQSELLAFLPFQVTDAKFVAAVYQMSYDATSPPPEQTYELALTGVKLPVTATAYDPLTDSTVPVTVVPGDAGTVTLQLPLTDSVRLLTLQEAPDAMTTTGYNLQIVSHGTTSVVVGVWPVGVSPASTTPTFVVPVPISTNWYDPANPNALTAAIWAAAHTAVDKALVDRDTTAVVQLGATALAGQVVQHTHMSA